jgi:hypothetical protein
MTTGVETNAKEVRRLLGDYCSGLQTKWVQQRFVKAPLEVGIALIMELSEEQMETKAVEYGPTNCEVLELQRKFGGLICGVLSWFEGVEQDLDILIDTLWIPRRAFTDEELTYISEARANIVTWGEQWVVLFWD